MPKGIDPSRLCAAMQRSRLMLQRPREERREALRMFAGERWSENTASQEQPYNLISAYIGTMLRQLVAKNPRAMMSTFNGQAKPTVAAAQTAVNREIVKMNLANSLRRWVLDAMFSCGWMKIGLATPADSAMASWNLKAGRPFAKPISLDDIVFDSTARDPDELQFIGHRFRVPLEAVLADKRYNKTKKQLKPTVVSQFNEFGDERAQELGRLPGLGAGEDDVQDMVDLWEIYCPQYRSIKVLADDHVTGGYSPYVDGGKDWLLEEDWVGPDEGPYVWMRLGLIPDNIMPKAPVHDIITLHRDLNHILRKLIRQAKRQKTVLPTTGANTEDAARLETTDDGFAFRCDNPATIKEVNFGGPNQQNFALFMALREVADFMAGNLALLSGRGAQSPTATQDKILNENASLSVSDMQESVINGVATVIERLTWWWWHDPFTTMQSSYQVQGLPEMTLPLTVTPRQRISIPWSELDIKIDPYSMQHSTPQTRLGKLNQIVQQIIMPLTPLLERHGIMFDPQVYLEKVARYSDEPDLQEMLTIREMPQEAAQSSSPSDDVAPDQSGERTYNRVSTSEQTEKGFERNLAGALMGVDQGGASDGGQEM